MAAARPWCDGIHNGVLHTKIPLSQLCAHQLPLIYFITCLQLASREVCLIQRDSYRHSGPDFGEGIYLQAKFCVRSSSWDWYVLCKLYLITYLLDRNDEWKITHFEYKCTQVGWEAVPLAAVGAIITVITLMVKHELLQEQFKVKLMQHKAPINGFSMTRGRHNGCIT